MSSGDENGGVECEHVATACSQTPTERMFEEAVKKIATLELEAKVCVCLPIEIFFEKIAEFFRKKTLNFFAVFGVFKKRTQLFLFFPEFSIFKR